MELGVVTRQSDLLQNSDQQLVDVVTDRRRYFRVFTVSLLRRSLAFCKHDNSEIKLYCVPEKVRKKVNRFIKRRSCERIRGAEMAKNI